MKSLSIFQVIIITVILFAGCKEGDESICGKKSGWGANLNDNYIYNELDVITGNRILIYEDITTPEDICPDEHVVVDFYVSTEAALPFPNLVSLKGKVYWGGFYEDVVNLTIDGGIATGQLNVGLKQAFGGAPGWIGVQVIYEFPTQGSFTADTTLVSNSILNMEVSCIYYKQVI